MERRLVLLTLLLASISKVPAASAQSGASPIRISGSTTVFTNVLQPMQDRIAKESGETLSVVANGSRQGLSDLAGGKSDIAMISAPLDELLPRLSESERAKLSSSSVVVTELAETRLALIVHETNPVRSLSIAQLKDLFTGVVTNWKEVGGPDLPVQVVSNQFSSGQRAVLEEKVTGGTKVTASAKLVVNDPQIPALVRQLKGGLGHSGAKNDLRGVAIVRTDREIAQPMSLVTLGKPAGRIAKVIAASRRAAASTN